MCIQLARIEEVEILKYIQSSTSVDLKWNSALTDTNRRMDAK